MWFNSEPPPGRYIALSVSDTGSGMTPDQLEVIFDPFYTTKFTGRGLGLSSTLGIVRSHAGHLRVQSSVGAGSTFTVLFPQTARSVEGGVEPARAAGPEFSGTVVTVESYPYYDYAIWPLYTVWRYRFSEWNNVGGDRPYHYLGSARFFTRFGHACGEAMVELGK